MRDVGYFSPTITPKASHTTNTPVKYSRKKKAQLLESTGLAFYIFSPFLLHTNKTSIHFSLYMRASTYMYTVCRHIYFHVLSVNPFPRCPQDAQVKASVCFVCINDCIACFTKETFPGFSNGWITVLLLYQSVKAPPGPHILLAKSSLVVCSG